MTNKKRKKKSDIMIGDSAPSKERKNDLDESIFTDLGALYYRGIYGRFQPRLETQKRDDVRLDGLSQKELNDMVLELSEKLLNKRGKLRERGLNDLSVMIKMKINEGYGYFNQKPTKKHLKTQYMELSALMDIVKKKMK